MKLKSLLPLLEPYTTICLTYKDMHEEWYWNSRLIPGDIVSSAPTVTMVGGIHPANNEFSINEPAIRIYLGV